MLIHLKRMIPLALVILKKNAPLSGLCILRNRHRYFSSFILLIYLKKTYQQTNVVGSKLKKEIMKSFNDLQMVRKIDPKNVAE